MGNLLIKIMQKVLNILKNHFIDHNGQVSMKLMIVMVLNYMKDKNVLHVKMYYLHIQAEIGHFQKEKILRNANILIFKQMEEECYLLKNLDKKKEHNNFYQ